MKSLFVKATCSFPAPAPIRSSQDINTPRRSGAIVVTMRVEGGLPEPRSRRDNRRVRSSVQAVVTAGLVARCGETHGGKATVVTQHGGTVTKKMTVVKCHGKEQLWRTRMTREKDGDIPDWTAGGNVHLCWSWEGQRARRWRASCRQNNEPWQDWPGTRAGGSVDVAVAELVE